MQSTNSSLSAREAAERLGTTVADVRRLARAGKLQHRLNGNRYRFLEQDVAAYLSAAGDPAAAGDRGPAPPPSDATRREIEALLASRSDRERHDIVERLGAAADREAAALHLIGRLPGEGDIWRRSWIVTALSALGTPSATRELVRRTRVAGDESAWVRFRALIGLARLAPPDVQRVLKQAVRDKDRLVRAVALRLLVEGGLVDPYLEQLLRMLEHEGDWDARWAACKALRRDSGRGNLTEPVEARIIPALVGRLRNTREAIDVKLQAALALGNVKYRWRDALDALTELSRQGYSDSVRRASVDALAMLETQETRDSLLAALTDEDAEIRVRAAQGLRQRLGATEAVTLVVEKILAGVKHREPYVAAIRLIDLDAAAKVLSSRLHDRNQDVVERASDTLVELGGEEAVRTLQAQRAKAVDTYTELLGTADERVMEQFKALMDQARNAFGMSLWMHATIFVAGLVVLGVSFYVAMSAGSETLARFIGAGGALGSLGTLLFLFYRDPLANIRDSVTHLVKVNVVFSGYVRQINQIDATFKQLYLAAQGFGIEQMRETVGVMQAAVEDTMREVESYLRESTTRSPRSGADRPAGAEAGDQAGAAAAEAAGTE